MSILQKEPYDPSFTTNLRAFRVKSISTLQLG
jgi:hypothetical protein